MSLDHVSVEATDGAFGIIGRLEADRRPPMVLKVDEANSPCVLEQTPFQDLHFAWVVIGR